MSRLLFLLLLPLVSSKYSILPENQLYYNRGDDSRIEEAVDYCQSLGGEVPHDLSKELIAAVVASGVLQPVLPSPYQFFWLNAYNGSDGRFRWNATDNIIDDSLWADNEPVCSDTYVCRVTIESHGKLYAEPEERERGILCYVDLNDERKRLVLKFNLDLIASWQDRRDIQKFLDQLDH